MASALPDENAPIALDLPDEEFVKTREAIIQLLPRLYRPGLMRYTSQEVLEHIIDETVADIGYLWRNKYDHERTNKTR